MSGIDRVARKEKELANKIRSDVTALRELQDKPEQDQSKIDALAAQVEWSTRIFDDRRKSIRYVCEVPTIIEQRVFALARDSPSPGLGDVVLFALGRSRYCSPMGKSGRFPTVGALRIPHGVSMTHRQ